MFNRTDVDRNSMRTVLNFLTQASVPYVLLISFIGIGGNFLTILVFARRSLSKNFNNCTLIALGLTDLLFNLTLICRCINDFIDFNGENLCRLLSFLSHLAELLSACFTAQFTAQRFIAVRFPLSVFIEKRIHLIHYFIVSLLILFGVVYCFALVSNNSYDNCHEELDLIWFISDALFSFLIPFTLIIVLNFLIIFHLKKSFQGNPLFRFRPQQQNENNTLAPIQIETFEMMPNIPLRSKIFHSVSWPKAKHLLSPRSSSAEVSTSGRARSFDLFHSQSPSLRNRSQSYRVTRMLIIVSTCFLLFNAPAHICSIGVKIYTIDQASNADKFIISSSNSNENRKQNEQTAIDVPIPTDTVDQDIQMSRSRSSNVKQKWMQYLYLMLVITQHLSYTSYSMNFFLYSFCGMKFRRELTRCISNKNRPNAALRSATVQNTL